MNWGYRIVVVFVLFMTFIVSMVVYISFKGADLVAEDYYAQEVNYQDIINAKSNSVEYKKQLKITQDPQKVVIFFPKQVTQNIEGTIHFYHPQHTNKDFIKSIALNDLKIQSINKTDLVKGNYTIKLFWKEGNKSYYIEKPCFVS
jgi:hypothetical protein